MRLALCSALLSLVLAGAAQAQSTVFTYQGRLKNGPALASGPHDLRFSLFNSQSGGTQLGSTRCLDNVTVEQGLFTVQIDFGQQFTTSSQRFIEVEVRADGGLDCSNASGFTVLGPRQLITATPIALHAKSANALSSPSGSLPGAVTLDDSGNVGIGTVVPSGPVHVRNADPFLILQDTSTASSQVGFISLRDNGNTERGWMGYGLAGDPDLSIVNARTAGDIMLNPFSGKVKVVGDLQFGPTSQFSAVGGSANLRIVRGTVNSAGGAIAGEGFTSVRAGAGDYTITFSTPFTVRPTVTATCEWVSGQTARMATTDVVTASTMNIVIVLPASNTLADAEFNFIAIGPR